MNYNVQLFAYYGRDDMDESEHSGEGGLPRLWASGSADRVGLFPAATWEAEEVEATVLRRGEHVG